MSEYAQSEKHKTLYCQYIKKSWKNGMKLKEKKLRKEQKCGFWDSHSGAAKKKFKSCAGSNGK